MKDSAARRSGEAPPARNMVLPHASNVVILVATITKHRTLAMQNEREREHGEHKLWVGCRPGPAALEAEGWEGGRMQWRRKKQRKREWREKVSKCLGPVNAHINRLLYHSTDANNPHNQSNISSRGRKHTKRRFHGVEGTGKLRWVSRAMNLLRVMFGTRSLLIWPLCKYTRAHQSRHKFVHSHVLMLQYSGFMYIL